MAAREILKYRSIASIDLIDLDVAVTDLFRSNEGLQKLNSHSLLSDKVHVYNEDAFQWIRGNKTRYDFIAVDFPDPSNYSLGKLYTVSIYRELYKSMKNDGILVVQSTSPYVAKESFWIINETLNKAGFKTTPYHCHVPSFGEWGYILAYKQLLPELKELPSDLKFVSKRSWAAFTEFPPDMMVNTNHYNTLNNQVLVNTFEREWAAYLR